MEGKKLINAAGNILVVLSLVFIFERIIKYKIDFNSLFSVKILVISIGSIIVYSIWVLILAGVFETLLNVFWNREILMGSTVFLYCKANLYKYLPGNIFHYIGRNQIAIEKEITHNTVISATILEICLLILASAITSTAFAGQYAAGWIFESGKLKDIGSGLILFLGIACFSIIMFALNSTVKTCIFKYARAIRQIRPAVFLKILFTYVFTFILNGVMFTTVLYGMGGETMGITALPIVGMYTFSWMVGFITPGAPAGLGIREAIMSALLFGIVDENIVITSVLFFRVVTIFGDVLGFLVASYINKALNKG